MDGGTDRGSAEALAPSLMRRVVALAATTLLLAACHAPGPTQVPASTRLPDDIVRALQTDERVLDCAEGTRDGRSLFQPDWVVATRVDLDDDGRKDWLVQGRHACLRRDGRPDWWIYADTADGRRLLGTQRAVDAVTPLPTRSGGFADLRVDTGGAARTLHYRDGGY